LIYTVLTPLALTANYLTISLPERLNGLS
jgi:hypothetical protein